MVKTVLLDLDGTLLDINMDYFIPYYLKSLGSKAQAAGLGEAQSFVQRVLEATDAMIHDLNPDLTNEDAFKQKFFRDELYDQERALGFFDHFYTREFAHLAGYCQPFAAARGIVEQVFSLGMPVVIATNAVFPVAAIEERLRWAHVADFPYAFLTHYRNMHFCKPYPEYYLEIAAKLKVAPEECLMIGNDVEEDLVAGTVGMQTFLLEELVLNRNSSSLLPDFQGKFPELSQFLDQLAR